MEAMEKGDLETAREMQWKSVEIIDVLIKHGEESEPVRYS